MTRRAKQRLLKIITGTPGVIKIGPVYATSGTVVPIVPDFRALYSYPKTLRFLGQLIGREAKALKVQLLAGVETAGIPLAAAASLASRLSMVYLRKTAHRGWTTSTIEGSYHKGDSCALIDDAITFGGQKIEFVRKLKGQLKVKAVIAIWDASYPSRFRRRLRRRGLVVRSLVTKLEVMKYMLAQGLIHQDTYDVMLAQTLDPWRWHKNKPMWAKLNAIKRRGYL